MDSLSSILLIIVLLILCGMMLYSLFSKNGESMVSIDATTRRKNVFPLLFSCFAMVLSFIAIALELPHTDTQYSFDYFGVIVAVLAILVTVLLGWQIYNGIKFEEQVRKASGAAKLASKSASRVSAVVQEVEKAADEAKEASALVREAKSAVLESVELVTAALSQVKEFHSATREVSEETKATAEQVRKEIEDARSILPHEDIPSKQSIEEILGRIDVIVDNMQGSIDRLDSLLGGEVVPVEIPPLDTNLGAKS